MAVNRGKSFELVIRDSFVNTPDTSFIRLHDRTDGFAGSSNPCDCIVYHYPYMLAIECKSIHGNTLPFTNITDNQWKSLRKFSKTFGLYAGIICWWIDKDVTAFLPIQELWDLRDKGAKSIRYDAIKDIKGIEIKGKKKRIFFEYDMEEFFNEI